MSTENTESDVVQEASDTSEDGFVDRENFLLETVRLNALKDWLSDWYDADYSWEGLKEKPWTAPDPDHPAQGTLSNLQEYWRYPSNTEALNLLELISEKEVSFIFPPSIKELELRGAQFDGLAVSEKITYLRSKKLTDDQLIKLELLVKYNGALWHVAHLPVFDRDGEEIDHIGIDNHWLTERGQIELFGNRLKSSSPQSTPIYEEGDSPAPETLAQLKGCVIRHTEPTSMADDDTDLHTSTKLGGDHTHALFYSDINWSQATFISGSTFENAFFFGDVTMNDATFKTTDFKTSIFGGDCSFSSVIFEDDAFFMEAIFLGYVSFMWAKFNGPADFEGITVAGVSQFDDAAFSNTIIFSHSIFIEEFSFQATAAPLVETQDKRRMLSQALFKDVTFLGVANFENRLFTEEINFSRASFYEGSRFYNCTFHPNLTFTPSHFHALSKTMSVDLDEAGSSDQSRQKDPQYINISDRPKGFKDLILHQRKQSLASVFMPGWFENLEHDFRNLKDFMGKLSATTERQDFHALELSARMRRTDKAVTVFEKCIGYFYKIASDFGRNTVRPLIGIALVFIVSVFGTALMADSLETGETSPCLFAMSGDHCDFVFIPKTDSREAGMWREIIAENAQRTLFPIFKVKTDFTLSGEITAAYPLRSTFLTLLQAGFSIVLIFLFLLTIKRRFQMS